MKTIMVLTDFSEQANHAAVYAVKFAQLINADVLLFNAYGVQEKNSLVSQIPWDDSFNKLHDESLLQLKQLAHHLKQQIEPKKETGFSPKINYLSDYGAIADLASKVVIQKNIGLLVMSGPKSGKVNRLFFGSDTHDLLDKVICPVMIVPYGVDFKSIEKIIYATDLRSNDSAVLHSLTALADLFEAEVLVAHISQNGYGNNKGFKSAIIDPLKNSKLKYKEIKGQSIVSSLCRLNDLENADMVTMVHKKYHFPESIFHSSYSKQMANYAKIPLLIYPFTFVQYLAHAN